MVLSIDLCIRRLTSYPRCSPAATAFGWTPRVKKFDNVLEDFIEVDIVSHSCLFLVELIETIVYGILLT